MGKDPETVDGEVVESGALTVQMPAGMSPSERIAEYTKSIAQLVNLQKAVRATAIGCTRARDWRTWGERLRPEASAADSIKSMFGVRITNKKLNKMTTSNGYAYMAEADFEWPATGVLVEGVKGSARSDDDMVATRYGYDKESGQREKIDVPSTDVDETNVIKKAETNLLVNGIISLFGLRNVSADELVAAGLNAADVPKTKFQGKAWEMSAAQRSVLGKFHATEAEVSACKGNQDVTALMNRLKEEKRRPPAAAAAPSQDPPAAAAAPPHAEVDEIVNNLHELAETLDYTPVQRDKEIVSAREMGVAGLRALQKKWAAACREKK